MDEWTTPPLEPMPTAPAIEPAAPVREPDPASHAGGPSLRRMVMSAGLAGLLLVAGGVAAVSAASPDPSSAPSTTAPSTTAPSTKPGGTTHRSANCPNMGGSSNGSGGSSNGSGGSSSSGPSTAPSPAT
jgi:hypothetical protein